MPGVNRYECLKESIIDETMTNRIYETITNTLCKSWLDWDPKSMLLSFRESDSVYYRSSLSAWSKTVWYRDSGTICLILICVIIGWQFRLWRIRFLRQSHIVTRAEGLDNDHLTISQSPNQWRHATDATEHDCYYDGTLIWINCVAKTYDTLQGLWSKLCDPLLPELVHTDRVVLEIVANECRHGEVACVHIWVRKFMGIGKDSLRISLGRETSRVLPECSKMHRILEIESREQGVVVHNPVLRGVICDDILV